VSLQVANVVSSPSIEHSKQHASTRGHCACKRAAQRHRNETNQLHKSFIHAFILCMSCLITADSAITAGWGHQAWVAGDGFETLCMHIYLLAQVSCSHVHLRLKHDWAVESIQPTSNVTFRVLNNTLAADQLELQRLSNAKATDRNGRQTSPNLDMQAYTG
jgi:hypothetical protein